MQSPCYYHAYAAIGGCSGIIVVVAGKLMVILIIVAFAMRAGDLIIYSLSSRYVFCFFSFGSLHLDIVGVEAIRYVTVAASWLKPLFF